MSKAMQLKARIKNIAMANHIPAQAVLQNFMLERLLERISVSKYKDMFVLKGGMLIVSISGRITSLRYYEDSRKWVFTLAAAGGNFYVECSSSEAAPALALGSQVMITGSLFSRRTRSGCDSGSICAREVLAVGGSGG